MASQTVSDHRSNSPEQIEHAAKVIGGSKYRLGVFQAVYNGKAKIKTVKQISVATGFTEKQVLTAGKTLDGNTIIHQTKFNKETAYEKDSFYATNKAKILRYVANPAQLQNLQTKRRPSVTLQVETISGIPKGAVQVKELYIDEIDSFRAAPKIFTTTIDLKSLSEKKFKEGVQQIIGETGTFTDWGGETNDLMTTRLEYKGNRIRTAFAFKGPGTKGKLTPKKMGKNGDQIQRLFGNSADLFVLQYWSEIDESVALQMEAFAKIASINFRKRIYYLIIDGQDTQRIVEAWPHFFK